jgi:hypothetical protein
MSRMLTIGFLVWSAVHDNHRVNTWNLSANKSLLEDGMRVAKLVLVIVLFVQYLSAQSAPMPQVWLQLLLPDGGTSGTLLQLNRASAFGLPILHSRTDATGTSVYRAYLVGQFEALSIRPDSVGLRFRLKLFRGAVSPDELMKQSGGSDTNQLRDAAKVPWQTITYIPGQVAEIQVDDTAVKISGSVPSISGSVPSK